MEINAVDVGAIVAILGLFFKASSDKATHAREMGQLVQQIRSLEARATHVDQKFTEIDAKIERLLACMTRLETLIQGGYHLETPSPIKRTGTRG